MTGQVLRARRAVTWKTYVSDHLAGIFAGNADAGQFLAGRFAGEPAEPNC